LAIFASPAKTMRYGKLGACSYLIIGKVNVTFTHPPSLQHRSKQKKNTTTANLATPQKDNGLNQKGEK
jgi:hypothetical protein